ncbi:MAG: DUF4388 domain-containing protein [Cyanobacteria bacterium P01_B01_bin.77]
MEIAGSLTEFPLPELLQFLDRRQVTGWLSLSVLSNYYEELKPRQYEIWLHQGHIVSAQREDHGQDVYSLAVQKEWIRPFVAKKLKKQAPEDVAAGLYLETQRILSFKQLRSLFFSEVVHRVESLCSLNNGEYIFQTRATLPMHKITGLRIPAMTVATFGIERREDFPCISQGVIQTSLNNPSKCSMASMVA